MVRRNLECAKDFQLIANLEHYKEKAEIESKRAEIENQTGLQLNLSTDSLPLAGTDDSSNPNQTTLSQESNLSEENPTQTLTLSMAPLSQTQNEEIGSMSVEGANDPLTPLDATQMIPLVNSKNNDGKVQVPEVGQSILNRQDVLNIAKNNPVKRNRPLKLMNAQVEGWETGHEDLSEILQGYRRPGGDTFRIHRELTPLLIMSAAAEMPNRAALQAKQDAYDQVTLQAQIELGKQIAEYEEQRNGGT